ncbi:MAG: HAD-IB family phosphatase [Candidatus Paceibacterota bacterium]
MKNVICFDVNGTLIEEKSWEILTCGREDVSGKIERIFKRYYTKELTLNEAWMEMVFCLKEAGMSNREYMYDCWEKGGSLREGAEDVISYLKDKGFKVYFLSCSIDAYLNFIGRKLGIDGVYAGSHMIFDDTGDLVSIESECAEGVDFKKKCLEMLAKEEDVDIRDIYCVGDGHNDIGAFKLTGRGIAIGCNQELLCNAWKAIDSLSEIKEIL